MKNNITMENFSSQDRKFGVLVVDDEREVRNTLCFGLQKKGLRVWRACNGRIALKTYWHYREQIDIVLLDVQMPELDGPRTLIKLRKLTTRVHCCFLTGDTGLYDEQTLLNLGAVKVFRKPQCAVDLAAKLLEIVTRPVLNPSFMDARRQAKRLRPVSPAGRMRAEISLHVRHFDDRQFQGSN